MSIAKNSTCLFSVQFKDANGTAINISTATTKEIHFRSATGVESIKTASFATNGTDGLITYTVASIFLDTAGGWSFQGHVILPAGVVYRSDIAVFTVTDNLGPAD